SGRVPPESTASARAAAAAAGRAAVGGSDAHALPSVARAWTEVPGARTRDDFLDGLRQGRTLARGSSGTYARLVGDISTVFAGAVAENFALAGRSPGDLGRLAGTLALVPVLALLPLIGLVNLRRERSMARVHQGRYAKSL